MRLALPLDYEDIGHTADVGVRVRGASAEEALARLVLAFGALVSGGGAAEPEREERLSVAGGPGLAGTAVAVLREVAFRLATEGALPVSADVARADEGGAEVVIGFVRRDPRRHGEGADVKAVTWHAARLEREPDGRWIGQLVFDV